MKRPGYLTTRQLSPALLAGARVLFAAILCALSAHANAWIAIAHGDDGYAFVESNADSSAEAADNALAGCRKVPMGCRLLGSPAAGPVALVIARANGGITESTSPDPLAAAERAVKDCKTHFKQVCQPDLVSWDEGDRWFAISTGNGGPFIEYGDKSETEAKSGALKGCRNRTDKPETCEIKAASKKPTWIAVADNGTNYAWAENSTKDGALSAARKECERAGGGKPCGSTNVVFNPGPVAAPNSVATVQARIERQHKAATAPRDADAVVRYSDTCHNTDCVRKYENGKTVRYTACLNPATALPMNDPTRLGGCGGTDSRGNFFGMGNL
ncbi:exported hypothetical protein [Paraburkholderia ribeironis]|uniref:DUF4189 domain-containing protein n=1 Tax=Paraburkholderia ribeironis TaxID=1247936 RepID=A0A1N7SE95_9BURK|nr:DUF4189 domain-containing protein [Paraburkholderia ribeironis]SIT45660.1 exported hypothetical protein [Paraburkholderia ribeironis]